MNIARLLILAGLTAGGAAGASGVMHWQSSGHRCDDAARAILRANESEAEADFWLGLAICLNDPGANLRSCWQDAVTARDEAEDEAEAQYAARLDVCDQLGHGVYDPQVNPADFSAVVTNSYLPLTPGRTMVYESTTSAGLEHIEVTTLSQTRDVNGVSCRRVRDVVTFNGALKEDTEDWYAQNLNGEVWYFGEFVLNYADGFVDGIEGSWRFGKDEAKPGIIMLAAPSVGQAYRQEYLPNVAEDVARVVGTGLTVTVAYGTFNNCIKTADVSPMDPGVLEYKYYAPGVGLILEEDPDTGEFSELIQIL